MMPWGGTRTRLKGSMNDSRHVKAARVCRLFWPRAAALRRATFAAEPSARSDQLRARGRGGEQRALVPHALPGRFGNGDCAAGRGAAGDVVGRGAAEASVEGRGPLSEVVGWRCLPPGSRSVGAASRRLAFGGTGRAHRQWRLRRRPMCSAL